MANNVTLEWKHPNPEIMRRGPRFLEYLDHKNEPHVFEPVLDSDGRITYTVPEIYARRLLSNQSDRFFLISPPEIIIRKRSKDGIGVSYERIKSVIVEKRGTPIKESPEKETEPRGKRPPMRPPVTPEDALTAPAAQE